VGVEGHRDSVMLVDGPSGLGYSQRRLAPARSLRWRREENSGEWSRGGGSGKRKNFGPVCAFYSRMRRWTLMKPRWKQTAVGTPVVQ
jgi:hypothetical protein